MNNNTWRDLFMHSCIHNWFLFIHCYVVVMAMRGTAKLVKRHLLLSYEGLLSVAVCWRPSQLPAAAGWAPATSFTLFYFHTVLFIFPPTSNNCNISMIIAVIWTLQHFIHLYLYVIHMVWIRVWCRDTAAVPAASALAAQLLLELVSSSSSGQSQSRWVRVCSDQRHGAARLRAAAWPQLQLQQAAAQHNIRSRLYSF